MPKRSARSPRPGSSQSRRGLALLLLAVVSVAAYLPTLAHEFVWDDLEQVLHNPNLEHWSSFPSFWQKDVLALSRAGEARSNYYRPLFFTTYLVLFQLFGPHPAGWHAAAILLHLTVVLAVFVFVRRLRFGEGTALATALLFALHPVHGESVSWVAAAFNDPPAALASLGALIAHLAWVETGRRRYLAAGLAAFAAALGFKESALALLFLLPLTEAFHLPAHASGRPEPTRTGRQRALAWLPYAGLAAGYLLVRKQVLTSFLGVYTGAPSLVELSPTLPRLAVEYLRFVVWPWGYSPSYPLRFVSGWSAAVAWGSLLLLLGLAALLVLALCRSPWRPASPETAPSAGRVLVFAALWCALAVLPALNVRSFRPTYLVHQRYLYLAVLGPCLLLAWWLVERVRPRRLGFSLLAGVAVVYAASNLYHDRFWATDVALWTRVSEVDPGNPAAFDWLGRRALELGQIDEARGLFERSVAADPGAPLGYRNLAVLYHQRSRQAAAALPYYEKALAAFALRAGDPQEMALCRTGYGTALAEVGRVDEGLRVLLAAAGSPPYPVDATRNAAVLLRGRGALDTAAEVLRRGLLQHPEDPVLTRMLADLAAVRTAAPAH